MLTSSKESQRDQDLLRPWLYRLVGIFVSVLFVYLAVRKANLSESLQVLGTAQPMLLGAGAVAYLAAFPVRALRWRLILRAQKMFSWKEILVPVFVGYMANNLLPARTGEVYRAHLLGRRARTSRSGAMGSIVVERTFDVMTLLSLILLLFFLFPGTHLLGGAALATGPIFFALAAGILFYGFAVDRTHQAIDKVLTILPQKLGGFINRRVEPFLRGIRGVSTARGTCTWLCAQYSSEHWRSALMRS